MEDRTGRLVLLSRNVFPATGEDAFDGYVAIEGRHIAAVGPRSQSGRYEAKADRVVDVGDRVVMPGMTDNHTFFTGWALTRIGADLAGSADLDEDLARMRRQADRLPADEVVLGHAWDGSHASPEAEERLTRAFPNRPAVAFTADRDTCWMNARARERYGFTPEECYAEKTWKLFRDYLPTEGARRLYPEYMRMLNRRGITQVKEMTFDDHYGFADVMEQMADGDELTLRVSMMSQPVGRGMDLDHGRRMRERFRGPFLRFSGFNRMTDRSIASGMAELKEPYLSTPGSCCAVPVEWDLIERELRAADEAGFRYSLHCQGNAAVAHVVDLYEGCRRDEDGRLVQRHAITDMEFSDPEDLARFGAMGGICEVYPQIQSLDDSDGLLAMVDRQIGRERFEHYWMRRSMWDAGCIVVGDTDLPLMLPSIGESIWCGCGGHMNDGVVLREENTLTVPEMLIAWTANGAYDCYDEDVLGTLEEGKLADVCVLEADVLHADPADVRDVNAALTISDGRIVYDGLE